MRCVRACVYSAQVKSKWTKTTRNVKNVERGKVAEVVSRSVPYRSIHGSIVVVVVNGLAYERNWQNSEAELSLCRVPWRWSLISKKKVALGWYRKQRSSRRCARCQLSIAQAQEAVLCNVEALTALQRAFGLMWSLAEAMMASNRKAN